MVGVVDRSVGVGREHRALWLRASTWLVVWWWCGRAARSLAAFTDTAASTQPQRVRNNRHTGTTDDNDKKMGSVCVCGVCTSLREASMPGNAVGKWVQQVYAAPCHQSHHAISL